jgi:hypothetical protein
MSAADDLLDRELDRAFLKPFRLGVLGVAALFLVLGGLLAAFGSNANRPEGVAERWLTAVGDTRRDGVKDQAREDVDEKGAFSLAEHLLPKGSTDGRTAFIDLEVGKATEDPDGTTVPFRLHQRIDGSAGPAIDGTVHLRKGADDGWRITSVGPAIEGQAVPSEGGRPAAEAPMSLFVGAVLVAVLIVAACSFAVQRAGRAAEVSAA